MIAKVKAISHGATDIAYISGESVNKKHPEKIHHLLNNGMPDTLDAEGIWAMMKLSIANRKSRKPIKNTLLRIELSPDRANVERFTDDDWQRLWHTFIRAFDLQQLTAAKGVATSAPTNIAGSRYTVWLHRDSKSGIPHLHAAVCRVDMEGNINNDHQVHLRAQRAAEAVAREFGWLLATDVAQRNINEINAVCYAALKAMPRWSPDDYFQRISSAGYDIDLRQTFGRLIGYTIIKGNSRYKASSLGKGRNLLATKLESTWQRMHPSPIPTIASTHQTKQPISPPPSHTSYTEYRHGHIINDITHAGETRRFFLPPKISHYLDDEFDYRDVINHDELRSLAVALFVGWLEAYGNPTGSSGGGGSSSSLPWGRDPQEDELAFARRCANRARQTIKPQPRKGYRRT